MQMCVCMHFSVEKCLCMRDCVCPVRCRVSKRVPAERNGDVVGMQQV